MSKTLFVGDPHAKVADLEEMQVLMDFIELKATQNKVRTVAFLGDLTDTHDVIRLRVLDFWKTSISKLAKKFEIIIISGNHDQSGTSGTEWSMSSVNFLKDIPNVFVVAHGVDEVNGFDVIPYTDSEARFIEAIEKKKKEGHMKVLLCHQTFDGAKFDNGFYAPSGFKTETVSHYEQVIVGHIHSQSQFVNIHYVGSPRWMSLSDANKPKGLWLWDNGEMTFIANTVTPKVIVTDVNEGNEMPSLDANDKNYVSLIGSSKWISSVAPSYRGLARVTPKPTDSKIVNRKQSYSSFGEFLSKQKLDVSIEDIIKEVDHA